MKKPYAILERELESSPLEWMDLATMSGWVGLSPSTLAKQIRRGKIDARRQGKPYLVSKAEVQHVMTKNRPLLEGWSRLVDVTASLNFHRNIGESVCRKAGWTLDLDMNGHCRISPEAEASLRSWYAAKSERSHWIRKTQFAAEIDVDPRVVDNLCRKMGLEIDHDIHGFVILSDQATQAVLDWKERRAARRLKTRDVDGVTWYSLRKTAEDAAAGIVHPRSPDYPRLVETYYRRFLLWMRNGLTYETWSDVRYFSQDVHDRLVDDLCVMEAATIGGVGVSTVKGWLSKNVLKSSNYFECRRSISRQEYVGLLRRFYSQSARLKKREQVPVKILDDLSLTIQKLGLQCVEDFIHEIEKETGIPAKELDALRYEQGFVHRSVKNTIDKWVLLAEQGTPVSLVAAGGPVEVVATTSADNEQRKRVLHLVATFLGKELDVAYDLVFADGTLTDVEPDRIKKLVDLIQAHPEATVYDPSRTYEAGAFLVHPSGGDYGLVVGVPNPRTIQVNWSCELGTITMAQRVESEYSACDAPMLVLH